MSKWDNGVKAWERQQGESEKAYEAFALYRDMGSERSLRAVTEQLNKSLTLIARWSSKWNWPERVRQYDNSLEQEAYKKAVKGVAEMQTRHIKTAVLMQKKAVEALDKLNIAELSPKDIISLIKGGSTLERETRGSDPIIESRRKQEAEQGASGLADAIMEAWSKRKEGEND